MKSIAMSEFKAKCIAELKALQESGDELLITLRGQPLARVLPIREGARQLGGQAGSMEIRRRTGASDLDDDFGSAEANRIANRGRA